jgi:hypothetical protein
MSEWTDDLELYDMRQKLPRVWCRETASPSVQDRWTEENPALGQCAVTALLVQDAVGGELMRTVVEGHGSHYYVWHRGGREDLTACQFPEGTVIPDGEPVDRADMLGSERAIAARTAERYALLRERFYRTP